MPLKSAIVKIRRTQWKREASYKQEAYFLPRQMCVESVNWPRATPSLLGLGDVEKRLMSGESLHLPFGMILAWNGTCCGTG